MNMSLKTDTSVGLVICISILLSVDLAKRSSVSYIIYMLSSKILTTRYMLLQLSRYQCVRDNIYWRRSFNWNVNTCMTGK